MRTPVTMPRITDRPPTAADLHAARRAPGRRAARRSFSLVEMLVALAVTVVAMAMVTNVFSVTTQTAAQSNAIAEVEMRLLSAAEQMRLDLEGCNPAESILAIYGRTQAAALTPDLLAGRRYYREMIGDPANVDSSLDPGYEPNAPLEYTNPRADIMMFFTNRSCLSKAPARSDPPADFFQKQLQANTEHSPVQVVYGHAAIAEAQKSGNRWVFPVDSNTNALKHIEVTVDDANHSVLPGTRWHLARRQALLSQKVWTAPGSMFDFTGAGIFDSIARCCIEQQTPNVAADGLYFDLDHLLSIFSPSPPAGLSIPVKMAARSPYVVYGGGSYTPPNADMNWSSTERGYIDDILFNPNSAAAFMHHVATVIEEPPLELSDNLGLHLLPGCVWFQVEILIPEDPRNSRIHPLSDQRRDTPRWVSVENGQMYVFVPDSDENRALIRGQVDNSGYAPDPDDTRLETFARVVPQLNDTNPINYGGSDTAENRIVRMWPYAIRVTFKAIDRNGSLDKPLSRTLVHWFE